MSKAHLCQLKEITLSEELKILFWNKVKAYNQAYFKDALDALKLPSNLAHENFLKENPTLFYRAFIRVDSKCDVVLNNMAKPFNAYIVHAEDETGERNRRSQKFPSHSSSNKIFQVPHRLDSLMVDMSTTICTCRKWDFTGIPCCHAIGCAPWMRQEAKVYVHSYFKKEKYL